MQKKTQIKETLISLSEEKYKNFSSSLIPNIQKDSVLGVRAPILKKLSKGLTVDDFSSFDFEYHEEKLLYAFVISNIRDFDKCVAEAENLFPLIDNWAVCDFFRPGCFAKNHENLYPYILKWLESDRLYTLRFAIGMLMVHFLDDDFDSFHLYMVSRIESDEYYLNMMISWYFATALAKQYNETIPYIEEKKLSPWVHNKVIQKARESNRIDITTKDYLKTLKL